MTDHEPPTGPTDPAAGHQGDGHDGHDGDGHDGDSRADGPIDREFTIVRVYDAPRALVWRAWTEPEHFAAWFGPRGYNVPVATVRMDLRPGGSCEFTMVSEADGSEYRNSGVILEVVEAERLVFADDAVDLRVTVTLADEGEGTRMTIHVVGQTGGAPAYEGWSSSCDKLAASLAAVG
jgi:uncharacterized protein YndB with AHSA1/START domain